MTKFISKQHFNLLLFVTFWATPIVAQQKSVDKNSNDTNDIIEEIRERYIQNSTYLKSYEEFSQQYKLAKSEQDRYKMANLQTNLSTLDRYHGDFDLAFDKLWEALLISEQENYTDLLVVIHRHIGILYDIYNKDSLALIHLNKAKDISNDLLKEGKIEKYHIVSNYFSLSNFWRDRENYQKALLYLDSCTNVHQKKKILPYIYADKGYCYLKLGKLKKAEKQLFNAKFYLREINSPYRVANYSFIGELKEAKFQYDSALFYYTKGLDLLITQNIHKEFKPRILEKIANINIIQGNLLEAVNNMKASKKSYEETFSATSKRNQRLFEIKNDYKIEIANNKALIEKQEALIADKNRRFLLIITGFSFISLAGLSFYFIRRQKNKIKQISLLSQLEKDKNKAVLEVKSKELTAYALKMIEMEEAVQAILNKVKKMDTKEYQVLKNRYTLGADNSWQEFDRRFTEVNTNFYETLCKEHPNLSSTELKHCALIKLNFNSHEMAKMLHITVQSVHTSRYRIRKKIGLDSNANLEIYIGAI